MKDITDLVLIELEKRKAHYNNQGSKSKNAENILFAKIDELQNCINIISKLKNEKG